MAFPVWAALAAAQMANSAMKEKRDVRLAANTQALSPWTGLAAGPIHRADPISTGMQAYGASVADEQAEQNRSSNQKLLDAQTRYFDSLSRKGAPAIEPMATQAGMQTYGLSPWYLK